MHVSARALCTVFISVLTCLGGSARAQGGEADRAGIITAVYGTATVTRASLGAPRPLKFRDDVRVRDRITTGEESLARILLGGKAVVTVRERSIVTITDSPSVSTVDVETGAVALAVAKERMRAGESIELRTPNAVAGIRGTVVVAEVAGRGTSASTRFILLTGIIDVTRLDAARHPVGAAAVLTPLQTITIDRVLSPVRPIAPAEAHAVSSSFKLPAKTRAGRPAEWVANDQVTQAVAIVDPDRVRKLDTRPDTRPDVKPDRGERADTDDKAEKVKVPVAAPATPVVPADAIQAKGKGKGKKD